ncbi:MAG: chemotaxis protein CheX [Desulfobulbaceae bacterium]|nr:MAG: chemotaxis protein CheX [Desulfobulbaceae bacterium]
MEIREKIIESTQEIFSSMVMMEVTALDESVTEGSVHTQSITGLIGLAGTYKGVLAIHMPNEVAMAVTSSFLGMDVEEINADVEDAIGELANMLGGNVKTILSESGRDINLSLPSTISGKEYNFQLASEAAERTVICFESQPGRFHVELQLES